MRRQGDRRRNLSALEAGVLAEEAVNTSSIESGLLQKFEIRWARESEEIQLKDGKLKRSVIVQKLTWGDWGLWDQTTISDWLAKAILSIERLFQDWVRKSQRVTIWQKWSAIKSHDRKYKERFVSKLVKTRITSLYYHFLFNRLSILRLVVARLTQSSTWWLPWQGTFRSS